MKELLLIRFLYAERGIIGTAVSDNFAAFTLEPPYKANTPFVSAIPEGTYICERDKLGKHQYYRIIHVPDRESIELHIGNFPQDTEGCPLFGESYRYSNGQPTVRESKIAMTRLLEHFSEESFRLRVTSIARL